MKYLQYGICTALILLSCACHPFDKSENRLIKTYQNPSASMQLIVFEHLGNTTTNNSIQASIQSSSFQLDNNERGNIFIADQIENILITKDSLLLVNWLNDQELELIYPDEIRIFKNVNHIEPNIHIKYKAISY